MGAHLDNWLKGLVATACVVVIAIGAVWSYDRYQQHLDDKRIAQARSDEAKFVSCKQMVERAIPGTSDISDALACSRLFSQLSWFEQAHQGAIQYRQRSEERRQREQAEKQRIEHIKQAFFDRESSANGTPDEACFRAVRTLYEFGGKDALYTIKPTSDKITAVRKCISEGKYTEDDVKAVGR